MEETLKICPDPDVPGVIRIHRGGHDDDFPRPFVAVLGGVHGNEACGLHAIEHLRDRAEKGELPLQKGTLFLIHGNPIASAKGTRYTGADLNRLFSFEFEGELTKERWTLEHRRAIELKPILSTLDAAIDLHSATAPTPPFGIVSEIPKSTSIARKLGLEYVTNGWIGPGLLGDKVLLHVLTQRGKPSLAVECGQHDDPSAKNFALDVSLRFLVATELLPSTACTPPQHETPIELTICHAFKKPSSEFKFSRPLIGLDQAKAGELIARDENLSFHVSRDCYLLMPNEGVGVGQDMVYLACPTKS